MIEFLLLMPLIAAALCYPLKKRRFIETAAVAGSAVTLAVASYLSYQVFALGTIDEGLLYMDPFSAYTLMLVSFVGLLAVIYSLSYIGRENDEGIITTLKLRNYYLFFQLFVFTMLLVCVSNNLGIMWIAIEGTTLASAYLVGLYDRETSVEAAWKYLVICSVGITLALLGIIMVYASSIQWLGESSSGLDWSTLMSVAGSLDPTLLKIAFIFVLVGYGTKVGLAPMHTWLPDAHSQAPTPVSALLSGVLLNCAMYGILRFHMIVSASSLGPGFSGGLLLLFGLISLGIAAAYIVMSKDYKRMLAYSSIEHMGIIAVGFGFGGYWGIFGALFHMLNHALAKTLMFFGAGNILHRLRTKDIDQVRGVLKILPATGVLFIGGALAITGCPPFSLFLSEFMVLVGGISAGQSVGVVLYLLLLVIVFAAFMYHVGRMVFGEPADVGGEEGERSWVDTALMTALLLSILAMGLYLPAFLNDALQQIIQLFPGGSS
ncbi:MAG: hydrogenase 4 subunit F [Methanomassiliicoccus sp.]|nr:hydrogenase 4 subunit F [Methanomassiliicoccus sp.]